MVTRSNVVRIMAIVLAFIILATAIPNIIYYNIFSDSTDINSTLQGLASALFYINIFLVVIVLLMMLYLCFPSVSPFDDKELEDTMQKQDVLVTPIPQVTAVAPLVNTQVQVQVQPDGPPASVQEKLKRDILRVGSESSIINIDTISNSLGNFVSDQ
jgi:uncharacterized membrane protein